MSLRALPWQRMKIRGHGHWPAPDDDSKWIPTDQKQCVIKGDSGIAAIDGSSLWLLSLAIPGEQSL